MYRFDSKVFLGYIFVPVVFILLLWFTQSSPVFASPISDNYMLENYGFGGGGSANSDSNSYSLSGLTGETDAGYLNSANYQAGAGLTYTMMANVPPAPTFTNPANYYNKLKLVVNQGGNASDTKYAIAISTDNFVSDIRYVQNDNTVGANLGLEDWQTYGSRRGASGFDIIGLNSGTTYDVNVAAKQGNFTETGFGPVASVSTVNPQMTFDIDVSATDTDTEPPFNISFGDLLAGSIINSPQKVWVDLSTNGESGGKVYLYGQNGGLLSTTTSYNITSATDNLATATEGFGAQGTSSTQTFGGPFSINSPYNVSANNVGIVGSAVREIFSSGSPLTAGRASFLLKAKSGNTTPASDDYSETLTLIASAAF